MITRHPDPECRKKQNEFLNNCPEEERELHAKLFWCINAATDIISWPSLQIMPE